MNGKKGFSLIELLIAIAILTSLTAIAVPNLAEFTVKTRVDNEISMLYRLLLSARNSAINSGEDTTVCPLIDNTCVDNWTLPIFVFTDKNNNKKLEKEQNEKVLFVKSAAPSKDKLQYGKYRKGVTYTASGHLSGWGQNGTFKYCPYNHANLSRGIIVATSGRLYKSFAASKGVDSNRSHQVILCR